MKQEFETRQIDARPILGIRATVTMEKIGEVMGPLFGEVYGYIQQSGQEPAGMPFSIYYSMDSDMIDLECGMPVTSPMEGEGRVKAGELPGGTVATVTHMGPYEALRQDVGSADGVDGRAGPPTRGCTLGSLRDRPRRRAGPVEVAYRHIFSRALKGDGRYRRAGVRMGRDAS